MGKIYKVAGGVLTNIDTFFYRETLETDIPSCTEPTSLATVSQSLLLTTHWFAIYFNNVSQHKQFKDTAPPPNQKINRYKINDPRSTLRR